MSGLYLVGMGAVAGVVLLVKSFLEGRKEATSDVHGRHVILEQAELRDFGDMPTQIKAIAQKLDQAISHDAVRRERLTEAGVKIDEALKILRRMENELEMAKRMREEEILRVRRREEKDDG